VFGYLGASDEERVSEETMNEIGDRIRRVIAREGESSSEAS